MCFQKQVSEQEETRMDENRKYEEKELGRELEEGEITVEGLTVEEAGKVREIWKRFIKSYQESGEEQEEFLWLEKQLREELPEKSGEEIRRMKEEIIDSIREYDASLQDLTANVEKGKTKERWFAERVEDAAKGVAVNAYGDYLNQIHTVMDEANRQMMRTVLRQDNGVKECINLDGFIAEQYHVNSFNAKAALKKSDFYAEIPKQGEAFGKNSFDVVIRKRNEPGIVHQYQLKFGKDAKATEQLLRRGDYDNQRLVVPSDQVEEVQAAFPNKTVTDYIGGTDKVDIRSDSLTKGEIKKLQLEVQESGKIPRTDWNIYNTKELAVNLGKQAGAAGIQAVLLSTGIELAGRAMSGEEIDGGEVVETALMTGADTGVKAAAGGALTVAAQQGILPIIPPGTPPGTIVKIACVGVENVKVLWKAAKGEITMSEALEQMGRTSTSMTAGLCCAGVGAAVGIAALGWIPIAGPIAGGLIGGMAGYTAGSKIGEKVYNGAKKIAGKVKEVASKAVEGVKSFASGVRSLLPW
ncbi:hypothetical protein EBB54_13435 [Schaedlerella arabinosiphila]|uniref:Uncharacterized protein n=2 Tax=Schaedlerella arabinosiphila TaxID=2044587 RepID=A0A3R8KY39_9FIRM|nr:hypothetical protein EBB54_13435 [Schaedlerella arabinosiphila]